MKHVFTTFLAITMLAVVANAQFTLSGQFRPRTEFNHGYKALAADNQPAGLYTAQRTRLNFNYKTDGLTTKLVLQDVRRWGSQSQLVANEDMAVSVHEAWAEVAFTEAISLKAGRQELIYDDHRIFGSVGWANQARSHDLAVFKYKGAVNAHFGIAHNEDGALTSNAYSTAKSYRDMQYVWVNKKDDAYSASFLFLNNGKSALDGTDVISEYSQTLGTHTKYKTGDLTVAVNAYYQMGKDGGGNGLSAYNISADLGYKASANISANAGVELLSGNAQNATDATNRAFTPFYGTNHKFNGWMDYFYVGNHGNSVGLTDIYAKAAYKKDKMSVGLHVHYFLAGATVVQIDATDPMDIKTIEMSSGLGTEIDLTFGYVVSTNAKINLGYSQMLGTATMQQIKGGSTSTSSNWAWLMLTVSPKFLAPSAE